MRLWLLGRIPHRYQRYGPYMIRQAKPAKAPEKAAPAPNYTEPAQSVRQEAAVMQKTSVISPFSDRVYFQNLTYELGSMRRTLERISKQIDDLESQLKEFQEK